MSTLGAVLTGGFVLSATWLLWIAVRAPMDPDHLTPPGYNPAPDDGADRPPIVVNPGRDPL